MNRVKCDTKAFMQRLLSIPNDIQLSQSLKALGFLKLISFSFVTSYRMPKKHSRLVVECMLSPA